MAEQKELIIYTDGACLGNPGPGGYGVVMMYGNLRKEISEGFRLTTNNRMEIMAAVVALRAVKRNKRYRIILHSDSRLLIDAINKGWLESWKRNNWRKADKSPVLNIDLWKQLDEEIRNHDVEFRWVKGHASIVENERCDVISKQAALQQVLNTDNEYEKLNMNAI